MDDKFGHRESLLAILQSFCEVFTVENGQEGAPGPYSWPLNNRQEKQGNRVG